jgi:hypothetical protein
MSRKQAELLDSVHQLQLHGAQVRDGSSEAATHRWACVVPAMLGGHTAPMAIRCAEGQRDRDSAAEEHSARARSAGRSGLSRYTTKGFTCAVIIPIDYRPLLPLRARSIYRPTSSLWTLRLACCHLLPPVATCCHLLPPVAFGAVRPRRHLLAVCGQDLNAAVEAARRAARQIEGEAAVKLREVVSDMPHACMHGGTARHGTVYERCALSSCARA